MKTIGELKVIALVLWNSGWRGNASGRPLDSAKPLVPESIARHAGLSLLHARQVNHLLGVWSRGVVRVGEYDKI